MRKRERFIRKLALAVSGMFAVCAVLVPVQMVDAAETAAETNSAGTMAVGTISEKEPETKVADPTSTIVIDGNIDDWKAMDSLKVSDGSVKGWRLAKSADGSKLYFSFDGVATSEWDGHYMWDTLKITFANGTSYEVQIANLAGGWIMPGAEVAVTNGASGTNAGDYAVECVLPMPNTGTSVANVDAESQAAAEADGAYSVTFAGTVIFETDIPEFVPLEEIEPVYEGIVIDGKYDDWAAVSKVEAKCPSTEHVEECLSNAACVFDGEYVYIYLQDGKDGNASGAGVASNGRYAITTDLGRQLVFQLTKANGGSVSGVEGAQVAYYGDKWEIAIPASELPMWKQGVSFGLYQAEPIVNGVVNIKGDNATGPAGEFDGIVYDGLYGDWEAYPHTLIQYATAGTQTDEPDGEGALYLEDEVLYGHVVSSMEAHLQQKGGEFDGAISICFNGNREYNGDKTWNLYPRLVAVAADGTIDWDPDTENLEKGSYEFYLADARGEYNTSTQTNISDLAEHEKFYGKMIITVGETIDETEFMVDLEQAAKFLSFYSDNEIFASDFKMIEAQFGEIGQDYLAIAGASSGPWMGIVIAMAVAGGAVCYKRRRNEVTK